MEKDGVIYVGNKSLIDYIRAVGIIFKRGTNELTLISRGKFISKAVDVAEAGRKKFFKELDIQVKSVKIGSQDFETKGKKVSVSTIEIVLAK